MLKPNETIVVPSGYWHTVLNTETTFAITENFMVQANAAEVLKELGKRPKGSLPHTCGRIVKKVLRKELLGNTKKAKVAKNRKRKVSSHAGTFK